MSNFSVPCNFTIEALAAKYGFDMKEATAFMLTQRINEMQMLINQQQTIADPTPTISSPPLATPTPVPRPRPIPRPRQPITDAAPAPEVTPVPVPVPAPAPEVTPVPVPVPAPAPEVTPVPVPVPAPPPAVTPVPVPVPAPPPTTPKVKKVIVQKLPKPTMQLPWCNTILSDRCPAVSKNYDLYTQCMNASKDGELCAMCVKGSRVPKFGYIADRVDNSAWVSPVDGKVPNRYVQYWTKKLNNEGITRGDVEKEAARFGLIVPDEEWIKPEKVVRARKIKSPIVESSVSGSDSESVTDAAAPARAPVKKVRKTKAAPAPAPIVLAEESEPTTDMVERSLATELAANPYDDETDEEDDEEMTEELELSTMRIDHGDGKGERLAMICADNYVYCYTTYATEGEIVKVGIYNEGIYKSLAGSA
jgi:hypothetical protein